MQSIRICGVRVDDLTVGEAATIALQGKKSTCTVFTPNAMMLEACRKDPSLQALMTSATLSLPDGAGVLLASRRMGKPLRARAAGIDFGEEILARAAERGLRVFLLGGKPGVASLAAQNLCDRFPGLLIAGTHDGYFEKQGAENQRVLKEIRESDAAILFVCFGFPLQERWILENAEALSSLSVAAALGGSLDVWSGTVKRAPAWVSACGMEWAWRTLREPRRIARLPMLFCFCFHSKRSLAKCADGKQRDPL